MKILLTVYLISFVCANLLVKHFGPPGLLFSSFFLIPFDFVARCVIHEKYKGKQLIVIISSLTLAASLVTVLINYEAMNIALASMAGFTAAQIAAGIFYQSNKSKNFFYKVNLSDLVAITFDSIIFQLVAFSIIDPRITLGQIVIKFAGGLLWYYIIFVKLKLHLCLNSKK